MVKKVFASFSLFIVTLLFTVGNAFAANVHLKSGPAYTDLGETLEVNGTLAGLGNETIKVTLQAKGNPTATCTNPSGKNQPAGHNPVEVTLTGTQVIGPDQIKNGNVTFDLTTMAPTSPIPGAPECPEKNWTENITDVAFTSVEMIVDQPEGTTALKVSCTFGSPTSDGSVPEENVTCVTSN